ncbi:MAG: ABC transporter permease, partial [Planctomycetota bacterium]
RNRPPKKPVPWNKDQSSADVAVASKDRGGQKQRLAIARTIGFNPPIMVYDEPTSGLDPATGTQVAQLIQHTHENYGETTLIVTHDYPTLLPIANNIFLLDPIDKCLRKIDSEDWESIPEMLEDMSASFVDESESAELNTVGQNLKNFFERTTDYFFGFWLGVLALIPIWKNPGWGARYLGHYCRLVFGPTALIYLSLAGVISGFVTTFFTFKFLPFSSYTEPLLIEDLLTGLGFAMYRIFVPVLGCVLIAARCGAAITSDIGGRQFGNQIDAMNSYGMKPERYLLTSVIWAFLVGTPILYFASFISARLTSLLTFVSNYPERGPDFWYQNFHRGLVIAGQDWYRGTGWLMAKLLCSGFGVAIISYFIGRSPKFSTSDVSRAITTTILLGTLYVLTVHFIFSLYEYEGIVPGSTVPAPAQ